MNVNKVATGRGRRAHSEVKRKARPRVLSGTKRVGRQNIARIMPMPGVRMAEPTELADYIVTFKPGTIPQQPAVGRGKLYAAGVEQSTKLKEKVQSWLAQHGTRNRDVIIGAPTAFPVVTIRTTPAIADRLKTHPEVKAVIRDSNTRLMLK